MSGDREGEHVLAGPLRQDKPGSGEHDPAGPETAVDDPVAAQGL
jgi:hypothetical protein